MLSLIDHEGMHLKTWWTIGCSPIVDCLVVIEDLIRAAILGHVVRRIEMPPTVLINMQPKDSIDSTAFSPDQKED